MGLCVAVLTGLSLCSIQPLTLPWVPALSPVMYECAEPIPAPVISSPAVWLFLILIDIGDASLT